MPVPLICGVNHLSLHQTQGGLDCRYETICETCSFFATNIEFRPTLQAQRDDAIDRDQHDRVMLYQNLFTQLDDETA